MALFVDSGWYSISTLGWQHQAHIGRNKGCSFINDKCVNSNGGIDAAHDVYCPTLKEKMCDWTGMNVGYCGTTSDSTDSTLPSYFDYWGGKKVGSTGYADNCPFPRSFTNTYCEDSDM